MEDGWNLTYSSYAFDKPKAVLVFLHGLGVTAEAYSLLAIGFARHGMLAILPSLRCDPDASTGIIDLVDMDRQTKDLVALVDEIKRQHPKLPIGIGAHSVGCSLVLRSLILLESRVTSLFFIAPVWTGHPDYSRKNIFADWFIHITRHLHWPPSTIRRISAGAVAVRWSLFSMFAARWWPYRFSGMPMVSERSAETGSSGNAKIRSYSCRHYSSYFCPDLEHLLRQSPTPMFFALPQKDEYSLTSAVATGLHWDRSIASTRIVVTCAKANHVTILRDCIAPLTQWAKVWLLNGAQ
jgi:pimeloyl-ACP methyl ester carboxylesterase